MLYQLSYAPRSSAGGCIGVIDDPPEQGEHRHRAAGGARRCDTGRVCREWGVAGGGGNGGWPRRGRAVVYAGGPVRCWAGGGIVADSRLEDEYQETFDKAAAMLKLVQQTAVGSAQQPTSR